MVFIVENTLKIMPNQSVVLWLFGLSGAGKSTIADAALQRLSQESILAVRLDGDDLRTGLNADLGFTPVDRAENLRRAAEVAKLFAKHVPVVLCSFITPLEEDRNQVRTVLGEQYAEVFVGTSLEECERRDPKGLYRRARAGQIPNFTGVSAAFDQPNLPALLINTESRTVEECVDQLVGYVKQRLHLMD